MIKNNGELKVRFLRRVNTGSIIKHLELITGLEH